MDNDPRRDMRADPWVLAVESPRETKARPARTRGTRNALPTDGLQGSDSRHVVLPEWGSSPLPLPRKSIADSHGARRANQLEREPRTREEPARPDGGRAPRRLRGTELSFPHGGPADLDGELASAPSRHGAHATVVRLGSEAAPHSAPASRCDASLGCLQDSLGHSPPTDQRHRLARPPSLESRPARLDRHTRSRRARGAGPCGGAWSGRSRERAASMRRATSIHARPSVRSRRAA